MSYSKGCSLLSLGGFVPGVGFFYLVRREQVGLLSNYETP
jgi:hypothetical protein